MPWNDGFAAKYVNYTILVVPVALLALWIYWHVSVKNWFTGPKHTIEVESHEALRTRPCQSTRVPELIREPLRS